MDAKEIANRIKELRQRRGMTLEQVSALTGFTKGYLSRIENSAKAPPLFTLDAIARALGVDITFLLSDVEEREDAQISIIRKNERKRVGRQTDPYQYTYEALAYKKAGKNMEPFFITVGFEKEKAGYGHQGEEFIFVLDGKMEFYYGDQSFRVGEGDSLYFDASVPHGAVSLGKKEAKVLCVIYSYKRI